MTDNGNRKLKIAMVGYHNTLPFLYGLEIFSDMYEVILDIPSKCFSYFQEGTVDIALVPVGSLIGIETPRIITDYCIGCDGEVETVCLYSNTPLEQIKHIWLDEDSRSSQMLTRILAKEFWKVEASFESIKILDSNDIQLNDKEGILMIGVKAFGQNIHYEYVWDLGQEWKKSTGLPFAFAVWIAKEHFDTYTIDKLNLDLGRGVKNIPAVLSVYGKGGVDMNLKEYYEKYIDYDWDADKQKAFSLYMDMASQIALVE